MSEAGERTTLDTNVAIYAFDEDGIKSVRARLLLASADFLSVQLLNEFANVAVRKRGRSWADAAWGIGHLSQLVGTILPIDADANREALRIAARYGVSFYDALMLAVSLVGGARTIYSEDMHHDLVIDGTLRIVDPFR